MAKRRWIEAGVKAKVALAAVREDCTASQLASKFGVHATQIGHWKRRLLEGAVELFSDDRQRESQDQEVLIADLYEQIGRLQMEQACFVSTDMAQNEWQVKRRFPRLLMAA